MEAARRRDFCDKTELSSCEKYKPVKLNQKAFVDKIRMCSVATKPANQYTYIEVHR
jgi:hypothetical protein